MGPLAGLRVVEFAGIGPGPMAAMLLADMGATVVRLDRVGPTDLGIEQPTRFELLSRGRRSIAIDLKRPAGIELALRMLERADASIEGFRPGTMERLGLGPDVALARNARLVYGRMTGWGQEGPLAQGAGHDLNYIALTGVLDAIGPAGGAPIPPLNLIGDFGGGALYLAFGMVCALLEARQSQRGQVVDAAMTDGSASLMSMFFGMHGAGLHKLQRGTNILDGGSAVYSIYPCSDGLYVSVAAIEAKFRVELFRLLGIEPGEDGPDLRARIAAAFKTKTRDEWCARMEGTDACFAPVLTMSEAPEHPHNKLRQTFIEIDGVVQPAPAPRFGRTKPSMPRPPEAPGASTREALLEWGFSAAEIDGLAEAKAIVLR